MIKGIADILDDSHCSLGRTRSFGVTSYGAIKVTSASLAAGCLKCARVSQHKAVFWAAVQSSIPFSRERESKRAKTRKI